MKKDSGKLVFRPVSQKFDTNNFVESDSDPELLFVVPFNSIVKILKISIFFRDNKVPYKMSLFTNLNNVDFSTVQDHLP